MTTLMCLLTRNFYNLVLFEYLCSCCDRAKHWVSTVTCDHTALILEAEIT